MVNADRFSDQQSKWKLALSDHQLNNPEFYINRELAQLEFGRRVLSMAKNESVPLLERLRFLCIVSSVLDEFFEIRVAGLKQQQAYGSVQRGIDNLSATAQLGLIASGGRELVEDLYRTFSEVILPSLREQNINLLGSDEWDKDQAAWLKRYFTREVAPVISPMGLDPSHPFPEPLNKNLAFIVSLEGKDAFGRNSGRAVVQVPRSLPRIVRLPAEVGGGENDFVLLSTIVRAYVSDLFLGMRATGCHQFRVTRNSDLFVDEEAIDDLLIALEGELSSRRFGDAVRLEVSTDCPPELIAFLATQFRLNPDDVYPCNGPVNVDRLSALPDLIERPDLKYPSFRPSVPERIRGSENIFSTIAEGDILLHHPFESFAPFLEFLRQAARDPAVVSIRQTLYRTGTGSAVVEALVDAATAGKDVLVVIELRARFDEEANIELANKLQSSGVQVVYGIVGHKTHAKMCLVIRREGRSLARYIHLGTGNYHLSTSRAYTDYGLFSCDRDLSEDVQKVFQQITSLGKAGKLKALLQSPFSLHRGMLAMIANEKTNALAGKPSGIQAKMNALVEPEIIRALYEASQAGVKIELIVRGVCSLRPGIKGVSDNISVRSVIGRFLEHTRVFCFTNAGDRQTYLSSADWMDRNFFRRVEVCFPIRDETNEKRVFQEAIQTYLRDNCQAWVLQSDGSYRLEKSSGEAVSAQEYLLDTLS